MKKYDLFAPGDRPIPFTPKEIASIDKSFPECDLPIHFSFRSDIRFNKETQNSSVVAISPHLVILFEQRKYGKKLRIFGQFNISDVLEISHSENEFVLVKTKKCNFITTSHWCALRFAQILYRNYILSFYKLGQEYDLEVKTSNVASFPDIELDISPSQQFQFCFSALCSKYELPYRHDVARYMHHLITSNNPIMNVSRLPISAFQEGSILKPLIDTIHTTKYHLGICATNFKCPSLLKDVTPLFQEEGGVKLIHFVNCEIEDDMQELRDKIEDNGASFVSYWNLNGNPKIDFSGFVRILELTFSDMIFLGFSNCGIKNDVAADLFSALSDNPKIWGLSQLEIGGVPMTDRSYNEIERFLKTLNKKKTNKITNLDISNNDNLSAVLQLISVELPNLISLKVANNDFTADNNSMVELINYVNNSKTLKVLDISNCQVESDSIAEIINAFSLNKHLNEVTLKLNSLDLHSTNMLPAYRAFLQGDKDSDKKWKSLHFDNNNLDQDDLLNLIPLFKQFSNLETLSLSFNFDSSMANIDEILCKLTTIKSLKEIFIAGDDKHQLKETIIPFLREGYQFDSIDVSGNAMGDSAFVAAIQLVGQNLKKIYLNDNNIKSIELLMQLISAVKKNENLISIGFPVKDGIDIYTCRKGEERELLTQRVGEIQVEIDEIISKHRKKNGLLNEHPFDLSDESLKSFILSLSAEFAGSFKGLKRWTHSCVCDELSLPLPFQRRGEKACDVKSKKKIEIGEMEKYETESMKYIVDEEHADDDLDNFLKGEDLDKQKQQQQKNAILKSQVKTIKVTSTQLENIEKDAKRKPPKQQMKNNRKYIDTIHPKNESDSSDGEKIVRRKRIVYSDDEDESKSIKSKNNKIKKPVKKILASSSSDDEIENSKSQRKKIPKSENVKRKRIVISSDSDENNNDFKPDSKKKKRNNREDDNISSDKNNNKINKPKKKPIIRSSSSEVEDEKPIKQSKKPQKQPKRNINITSSSDSEPLLINKKKKAANSNQRYRTPKLMMSSDDDSDSNSGNDEPTKKQNRRPEKKNNQFDDDDDDDNSREHLLLVKKQSPKKFQAIKKDANDSSDEIESAPQIHRNVNSPRKKEVKRAPAPPFGDDEVLKPRKKRQHQSDDDDDDELLFKKKKEAQKKRKIERNPLLDGTPLDTYFGEGKVPYSEL